MLNHILRHNSGRRFALLINDFGSINIDVELIENLDGKLFMPQAAATTTGIIMATVPVLLIKADNAAVVTMTSTSKRFGLLPAACTMRFAHFSAGDH